MPKVLVDENVKNGFAFFDPLCVMENQMGVKMAEYFKKIDFFFFLKNEDFE